MNLDCSGLINAIDAYIAKAEKNLADILEDEGFAEPVETSERINLIQEEVANILDEQNDLVYNAANESTTVEEFAEIKWPEIKSVDNIGDKITAVFHEHLDEFVPTLAGSYLTQTDSDLSLNNITKKTTAWIKSWSEELGSLMKLGVHKKLESILVKGLEEGYGIQKFVQELLGPSMGPGLRNNQSQARSVAVTEVLRAHSFAQEEAIQQSPAVEYKEWVHTGSYRNAPRANHMAINGQVVAKNVTFILNDGEYYPEYPRDTSLPASESINCHCIHRGVVSKDILGLSLEERQRLQAQAIAEMDDEWEKELNERNKAKAGIVSDEPDAVRGVKSELGRLASMDKDQQVKYMGGKQKWALYESGVISDDDMLLKVKTSTLKNLHEDGIMTIGTKMQNHSSLGNFTPDSGRLKSGGHGQENINELNLRGKAYKVEKTYSNGVRIGGVDKHKNKSKEISTTGQSWFPESWSKDDITVAGTYVANLNKPAIGQYVFGEYNGVRVGLVFDDKGSGTIFPDNARQPFDGEWEENDVGE